ncbi:MAG TPA: hypothetical protein VNV18_01480 [Stellaceae bacterium]|jgi:hypothetical protein|nr:hypothetical protein [Stellaceae bacterium]
MADANPGQSPPNPAPAPSATDLLSRDRLALVVVIASFLTIFALVFVLLVLAEQGPDGNVASGVAEKTFNTILPVLAAWVGTVLAFYFSARSNERTSNSLDRVIAQTATGPSAPGGSISEKMIPFGSIREAVDLHARNPESIPLSELQQKFRSDAAAPVTRLIFHDTGVFRYVMHQSTLNAFLQKTGTGTTAPQTLLNLLTDPDSLRQISKLVVFVPASATLMDGKAALDGVPGAQDIIVTATGNASQSMLGWLTNVDLIKSLSLS